MTQAEETIHAALRRQPGGEALVREPGLFEELWMAFRGTHRWFTVLAFAYSIAAFVVAVWAGFKFHGAETIRDQLLWGGVTLLAVLFISFLKVWFWLEMHTNRVLRRLRRVELLLVARGVGSGKPRK